MSSMARLVSCNMSLHCVSDGRVGLPLCDADRL